MPSASSIWRCEHTYAHIHMHIHMHIHIHMPSHPHSTLLAGICQKPEAVLLLPPSPCPTPFPDSYPPIDPSFDVSRPSTPPPPTHHSPGQEESKSSAKGSVRRMSLVTDKPMPALKVSPDPRP